MSEVWETSQQDKGSLLVLLALADFADDDGYCYPSVETVARKSRLTERHTRRILRKLEDDGEIESQMSKGGRSQTTLYRVIGKRGQKDRVSQKTGTSDAVNPDAHVPRTVKNRSDISLRSISGDFQVPESEEPEDLFPDTLIVDPQDIREEAIFGHYLRQFANGGPRPSNAILGKNRRIARKLAEEHDDQAVAAMLAGIPKTFPLNRGAWDMFKLRKHASDAIANGSGRKGRSGLFQEAAAIRRVLGPEEELDTAHG